MEKNDEVQAEIDRLSERSSKISRRKFTKAAIFAVPALSVFTVSRQALGQTGSGADYGNGGGMMMNNGGGMMMNNGGGMMMMNRW